MADPHAQQPDPSPQAYDREISYKGLLYFLVGLTAVIIAAGLLMWLLSRHMRSQLAAADPPPPALAAARQPYKPPAPNLQTNFDTDIEQLHAREKLLLDNYAWVNRESGAIRIPIDRAMQIVTEKGFPVRQGGAATAEEEVATEPDRAAAVTVEAPKSPTPTGENDATE